MSSYEVITGDCVEVMRGMDGDTFDLCVTSPPYDNLRQYKGYSFDFEATAKELYRVIKPGGVVVWVVADATVDGSETGTSMRQALFFRDVCGFRLHDTMIYEKDSPQYPDVSRYGQTFEYMFVFSKGRPKTVNLLADRKNVSFGRRISGTQREAHGGFRARRSGLGRPVREYGTRFNVWRYNSKKGNGDATRHPAPFPEGLAYDHIMSWSNEGDLILDPLCGSGRTGKEAVVARRNFVGIEVSPEYAAEAELLIKRVSGEWAEIPTLNRKPSAPAPLFELTETT